MTTQKDYNDPTTHPNHPFMEAKDTFYGIELEVTLPLTEWSEFSPAGYSQRQGAQIAHYPVGWKATYDNSIHPETGSDYFGVEIVSPKLQGFDGIVQLVQVLDDLNDRKVVVNASCGIHIHIDGSNLELTDIEKLKTLFATYEKVFFGVLGPKASQRYTSRYCKPSDLCNNNDASDKYRALNLVNYHSFSEKKTVEFRLFSGEGEGMQAENIITYLYMAMAIVVYSRNSTRIHRLGQTNDLAHLSKKLITNVLSTKTNQIVPEYEPETPEDGGMWDILKTFIPQSTLSL